MKKSIQYKEDITDVLRRTIPEHLPNKTYTIAAPRHEDAKGTWYACTPQQWTEFTNAVITFTKREWFMACAPFATSAAINEQEARDLFAKAKEMRLNEWNWPAKPEIMLLRRQGNKTLIIEEIGATDIKGRPMRFFLNAD